MGRELLPNELLWESGHASELTLSSLADGEDTLLSRDVVDHVHSCDACAMKLGEAALVMRGVTHAVASVKPWLPASVTATVPKKKREPMPFAAMWIATVVAVAGTVPTVLALPRRIAEMALTLMHTVPIVSRSGMSVVEHGLGAAWLQATCASALCLVAAGFAVTRLLPRPATS